MQRRDQKPEKNMKNATHALDVLGSKLGIKDLDFDASDQAAIDLNSDVTIFLTKLDDDVIEVSCLLDSLGYPDAAMMQAMLEANFLGSAVDCGRLALDADKSEVILCERWMVSELDATALERRFASFALAATFWLGEGTISLMEQANTIRKSGNHDAPEDAMEGDSAPLIMRL